MAKDKKSVLLYCDIIHTVEGLTDEEAGALFKHYLRYINDLNPVSEDRLTALLFEPIKQNLKRDLIKWESKSERNSIIAKEGWVKRKDANASERIKPNAKDAVKDKVTVTVKDKVIDIIKKEERFSFRKELINYGFEESLVEDWLKVRKTKKSTNTKTAFTGFINQVEKTGKDKNFILRTCIEKSWSGFKVEWLEEKKAKEIVGKGFNGNNTIHTDGFK